ncbi:MAG: hypothetical protein IKU10_02135 [Clostridia bacterium]|nr:hypothetical protein [Clostridia bacterium]
MKTKRLFAWVLTVIMALSCLSVLPMTASAETATIDGEKDAVYTDAKSMTVTTAYAGVGAGSTTNSTQATIKTYYTWDDSYNYVYMEISEPGYVYTAQNADVVYYVNNPNVSGYFFQAAGGGYIQWTIAQGVDGATSAGSTLAPAEKAGYIDGATGQTRRYEFKFDRDPASDGFFVSPAVYGSASYVVSYHAFYSTNGHYVKYADESTWAYTDVTTPDPDPTPDPGTDPTPDPEPTPDPDPVPPPTPSEDGLDAIKDDRYTEEKCTTISIAYGGSGAGKIVNRHHIYTKLYYAWDDNFNYVYFEIHDPFMTQGIDILYYITNTNAPAGIMFQQDGGGYLQWDTATGQITAAADVNGREIKSASYIGNGVRQYEVILPKTDKAIGLQLSPVAYRENGAYSVSYDTNYYMLPNKNINYENQAGHWTDNVMTDADVMTDPSKIEAIEAELAKLPQDVSSLTYENDYDLVAGAAAAIDAVPDSWIVFIDKALYNRYLACKAKMDELEAAARNTEITEIEAKIDALPNDIDLEDLDAVEEIRELIANLGSVAAFINAEKMAKFNAAASRVDALQSPIKVDGKKDPAYEQDDSWAIEQGYLYSTQSDMFLTPTDSYGVIQTMADDKYFYVYFEVFDSNGIIQKPTDVEWTTANAQNYDSIFAYVDPDPINVATGKPYQDADMPTDGVFNFYMLADGTIPAKSLTAKNQFMTDASNFVGFSNGNNYGFELRVPRVENEESFKLNIVFYDPGYELGDKNGLQIALGGEWSYNYVGYGEKYFEDYPTFMNYLEVLEGIEALPAPEDVVDNSKLKKAQKLKEALGLLNEDQRAFISAEKESYLDAVIAAMENAGPGGGTEPGPGGDPVPGPTDVVYGDLTGDGEVSASDALEVLKSVVGKVTLTADQKVAADVTGDGEVSAADALDILKKVVGKIDKFAAEK